MNQSEDTDAVWMRRALDLAIQGEGRVEPNPLVGCVLVRDAHLVGEGFHQEYGGPHAEIHALRDADRRGESTAGATAYVTLEPCSHQGKTGPCAKSLIDAGIVRVVIGHRDPFPAVAGQGIELLESAGIEVCSDVLSSDCRDLNAAYLKRVLTGRPWMIGKWAMTLDGKIATKTGNSRWISNTDSRQLNQRLRGRVDAIVIGIGTGLADDPMLTARPHHPEDVRRVATRVVLDSRLRTPLDSRLVQSATNTPVLLVAAPDAPADKRRALETAGCEVLILSSSDPDERWELLETNWGQRQFTNVLIEGGGQVLGDLHDRGRLDELQIWLGPKLFGGAGATPIAGQGVDQVTEATIWDLIQTDVIDGDLFARYRRPLRWSLGNDPSQP